MQLILVVESNKESQSDYIYIKSVLDAYFDISYDKLTPIFLGGKEKFNNKKTINLINADIKKYGESSKSKVIYFIDYDASSNPTNRKIEKFCKDNGFELVWFNLCVEDVFLNKRVTLSKEKVKLANEFLSKNKITKVKLKNLKAEQTHHNKGESNIFLILEKYLGLKQSNRK